MNYENWISYRYLTAKKNGFLTFLNFISVAGVATGVMSLIVVIGVMTGFGNNLREKIIGTTPHLVVEKETGIKDFPDVEKKLRDLKGVTGTSPFITGNIFLENHGQALGAVIRGIDPETEPRVTKVSQYLKEGRLSDLTGDGIFIGKELARYFDYKVGDKVTLIAPGSGLKGRDWRYEMTVAGIFSTGMVDYDMNLLLVNLTKAQEIFGLPADKVSGIGVKIEDPYEAQAVKQEVYETLGYSFLVKSWIDMNRNLFEALFLEKWGLFIVLSLMVLIASLNIISTLIVTVMSKTHDIGILQAIGVPRGAIRRIFTKQGMYIGTKGTLWGVILGVGISHVLRTYVKVPEQIYSIDHVPVELQLTDMLIIVAAALLICFLATVYPAARASRLEPVDALRYE